jgi:hypothetical protein
VGPRAGEFTLSGKCSIDAAEAALILLYLRHDYPSQLRVKSRALIKIGVATQTLRGGVTKANSSRELVPSLQNSGRILRVRFSLRIVDQVLAFELKERIGDRRFARRRRNIGEACESIREAKNARAQS